MSISLTRSHNMENLAAQLPRGRQMKREGNQIGLPTSESKRTKHSALTSLQKILPARPTIRVKRSVVGSAADKAKQGPTGAQRDLKGEKRGTASAAHRTATRGKESTENQENMDPNCPLLPGGREKKSFFSNPFTKKKALAAKQEQEPTALKPRPPSVMENRKPAVPGNENRKPAVSVRPAPTVQNSKGLRSSATSHLSRLVAPQSQRAACTIPQVPAPPSSRNVSQSHLAAPQLKRRPLGQLPTQATNSDSSCSSVSDLAAASQNASCAGDRPQLLTASGLMNQSLNSSFLHTFSKMNTADKLANQRAEKENPTPVLVLPSQHRAPLLSTHVSNPATCHLLLLAESTEVSVTPVKSDVVMQSPPPAVSIPDPLGDLDRIASDHLYCPEYAGEIFRYLRSCEVRYMPSPAYLTKQQDINEGMRSILVDWLVEVSGEYKMTTQTLYLAVNYIDRFLSCMSVSRTKLQLVGTCCMYVASKFEEIYPPDLAEFVFITDDTYSKGQVIRMEALLLKALGFNLLAPTAYMFAERFVRGINSASDQLKHLLSYLCELALLNHRIAIRFRPSLVAAASLSVAAETLRLDAWSGVLTRHTGYSWGELQECRSLLLDHFRSAPGLQQQAIQEKYRAADKSAVSQLRPPLPRQVSV